MIRVARGPEPPELAQVRARKLKELAPHLAHATHPTGREIGEDYQCAKESLFRAQRYKCAYCELMVNKGWSDVEHFRPKAEADRAPGRAERHGYWWLAWTWDNLLLSCNVCNRPQRDGRGKGVRFPLGQGSGLLAPGQFAASVEAPLLLDPGADDAIEHIVFRRERRAAECVWVPRPRNGSLRGDTTIRVCALDVTEKVELYTAYVRDVVTREVDRWEQLHPYTAPRSRLDAWRSIEDGLYAPSRPFVALSYDALCVLVDDDALAACGAARRRPGE